MLFILLLVFIVSLLFYAYSSLVQFQRKDWAFKTQDNVLILTAHPDDECMFFGPTITTLKSIVKCRLHVLCLSTGNE